jgi:hypothetical protein
LADFMLSFDLILPKPEELVTWRTRITAKI